MMTTLFVYGTLRAGCVHDTYWRGTSANSSFGSAIVRHARLALLDDMPVAHFNRPPAPHDAILGDAILGDVLVVDAATLRAIDRLLGRRFHRTGVVVELSTGVRLVCDAHEYAGSLARSTPIDGGSWLSFVLAGAHA